MARSFQTGFSCVLAAAMAPVAMSWGQAGPVIGWGHNGSGQASFQAGSFVAVAGSSGGSVAIREDRTLFAWGDPVGPLPPGRFSAVDGSTEHFIGIRDDGTLVFWGQAPTPLNQVPSGTFRAISTGRYHAVGLRTDGTLVQWGVAETCPAGNDFVAVAAGEYGIFSFAIRADGTIIGWGDPAFGVLNVPPGTYSSVVAGVWVAAALRTDGTVVIWGDNIGGPLPGLFSSIAMNDGIVVGLTPNGTLQASALAVPSGLFVAVGAGNSHHLAILACYANCDGSTVQPALNVNDFVCFMGRFAAGSSYANCDGSTAAPILNVNDFVCFMGQFAAGCP